MPPAQQHQQQQEEVHPFDMNKSDFEQLLDRDLRVDDIKTAQEEAAEAQNMDNFRRAMYLARAVDHMRSLVKPVIYMILPLQNSQLGFKTDKKGGGYNEDEVLEAVIEALLNGANLTGNEFNIIAGRCYLTKEFFERKIDELAGLTDFVAAPGVPRIQGGSSVVLYSSEGKYDGHGFKYTREIAVRVNEYQGPDAVLGKAKRKFYKWLLETLTKAKFSTLEDGSDDTTKGEFSSPGTVPTTPTTAPNNKLSAAQNGAGATPAAQQEPAKQEPAAPTTPARASGPARAQRTGARPGPQQAQQEEPATPADTASADSPSARFIKEMAPASRKTWMLGMKPRHVELYAQALADNNIDSLANIEDPNDPRIVPAAIALKIAIESKRA